MVKGNLGLVKEKQEKMNIANIGDPDVFDKSNSLYGRKKPLNELDSQDDLFAPANLSVTMEE